MSNKKELLEARLEGFYETNIILLDALARLKTSLNDYAAIEYQDFLPKEGRDRVTFAHNTLTVLEELFLDQYDIQIQPLKWELDNE